MSPMCQKAAIMVGIAGGTGCGKTALAASLIETLHPHATLVSQDWYYRDRSGVPPEEVKRVNFDHPKAFDNALLRRHLLSLKAFRSVEAPRYDYATHCRTPQGIAVPHAPIVLLEGILILHDARLRAMLDLAVFIDAPADVRLMRRLRRDCSQRGIPIEEILRLYETFARPMHERFVQPSARHATLVWDQATDSRFPSRLTKCVQLLLRK